MAKIPQYAGRSISVAAGATVYFALTAGGIQSSATEADCQRTVKVAGRHSNLYIYVESNTIVGDSTIKFRKNGGDGNQTKPITGLTGTAAFEDAVNVDDVVDTDLICGCVVGGAAGTSLILTIVGTCFAATTNTVTNLGATVSNLTLASSVQYGRVSAVSSLSASEDIVSQYLFKVAGVLKNLVWYITANARTTDTTNAVRLNGATQGLTKTITTETGQQVHASNPVTVAVDDLLNRIITTGSGSETLTGGQYYDFETTDRSMPMFTSNMSAIVAGATSYEPVQGRALATATEASTQIKCGVAGTFSLGYIGVSANVNSGTTTVMLRKNGADTILTFNFTTGTGWIGDASNSVHFDATDLVNWKISSTGSGNITSRHLMLKFVADATGTIAAVSSVHHQRGLR